MLSSSQKSCGKCFRIYDQKAMRNRLMPYPFQTWITRFWKRLSTGARKFLYRNLVEWLIILSIISNLIQDLHFQAVSRLILFLNILENTRMMLPRRKTSMRRRIRIAQFQNGTASSWKSIKEPCSGRSFINTKLKLLKYRLYYWANGIGCTIDFRTLRSIDYGL